jgi:hypothetical protein
MKAVCEGNSRLYRMDETDYRRLYQLMKTRNFPGTPGTEGEAWARFRAVTLLGLSDARGNLVAGFVFGPPENGLAFFDVVCTDAMQGRWATPRVLKSLFSYAFTTLGLRGVWVESVSGKPLRAALGAGFVPVTPLQGAPKGKPPVLMMTPNLVPQRLREFNMNDMKETTHGKPV